MIREGGVMENERRQRWKGGIEDGEWVEEEGERGCGGVEDGERERERTRKRAKDRCNRPWRRR